ncbi:hypothetical protein PBCVNEJV1_141R [Paramecium bursaria Chlorella virus NE-JV-1]|nr:hypothetical protein PBCVNEJV1_141R [Paramecium bursaria Chlorella virus NE-JV-1]
MEKLRDLLKMKPIHEVIAYGEARSAIENLKFTELEPTEIMRIKMREFMGGDMLYLFRGKPKTIMAFTKLDGEEHFSVIESTEEVREHMLVMLDEWNVVNITIEVVDTKVSTPIMSRDIIRTIRRVEDGYSELLFTATYEDALSKVHVRTQEDGKYNFRFCTFCMGIRDAAPPIVETYKVVKNHECAIKHISDIFRLTLPFEDSFLTVERKETVIIFEYSPLNTIYKPRIFHEELLAVAWQPALMKNCMDEHELCDRWNIT